ncbi:MAG TPA: O-methyltransferase [Ferruginibacter sp.]|nr:O-methyltransferase [Ferruginibacter sp.]HRN79526.1 O-methyltransferase [Ferruginibacter sp.]HRO17083.1 O-methyltransferase [Ferruginibacter sp.]HRQ20160.1 O-methyltransferase [Ferruginibacter sp.]
MELVHSLAEQYAAAHSTAPDAVCTELIETTLKEHRHAHMLCSPEQGKLLEFISCMIQPVHVLEIGTFTGYTAICLAKGLQTHGSLHTIELREADAATAKEYIRKAGLDNKIVVHTGDARTILPQLNYTWDLVFIDADKVGYIEYYELTLQQLRQGGFILADNVLFHGQVLEHPVKGKNPEAVDAFNQHVRNDSRVEQVMVTIRDGLSLIRKL